MKITIIKPVFKICLLFILNGFKDSLLVFIFNFKHIFSHWEQTFCISYYAIMLFLNSTDLVMPLDTVLPKY